MKASLLAGLLTWAVPIWSCAAAGLQLWVATNGNDSATGSGDAPFRTIERARDEIRRRKSTGELPADGAVVTVRSGIYELGHPLEFSPQDGGTSTGGGGGNADGGCMHH